MSHDLDTALAKFPGPLRLNASRANWIVCLLLGLFVAVGVVTALRSGDGGGIALGILGAPVVGVLVLGSLMMLHPDIGGLTLDADGFSFMTWFRRRRCAWKDVSAFLAADFLSDSASDRVVVFDHAGRKLTWLNRGIEGRNSVLPDTYGFSAEDLVALMNGWRSRALASAPPAPMRSSVPHIGTHRQ